MPFTKKFFRKVRRAVVLVLPLVGLWAVGLQAQVAPDVTREVLVQFRQPGVITFNGGGTIASASYFGVTVHSTAVKAVLDQYQPELITEEGRNENLADTTRISPEGRTVRRPIFANTFRIQLPPGGNLDGLARGLDTLKAYVIFAERNGTATSNACIPATNRDQLLPQQWHLRNVGQRYGGLVGADIHYIEPGTDACWVAPEATATTEVWIIDTGVESTHPDFAGNATDDSDPQCLGTHGTWAAGKARRAEHCFKIGYYLMNAFKKLS